MNYDAAVRYLLSLGRELAAPTQATAAKFDLDNISVLAERMGRPDRAYPTVHIAGTNGKGSTAAFLESILRRAGFRTGLYTSPHLERINERLRVNGEEIADESFVAIFTRLQALIEELLAAHKLDRKSTRLNSSHYLHDALPISLPEPTVKARRRRFSNPSCGARAFAPGSIPRRTSKGSTNACGSTARKSLMNPSWLFSRACRRSSRSFLLRIN